MRHAVAAKRRRFVHWLWRRGRLGLDVRRRHDVLRQGFARIAVERGRVETFGAHLALEATARDADPQQLEIFGVLGVILELDARAAALRFARSHRLWRGNRSGPVPRQRHRRRRRRRHRLRRRPHGLWQAVAAHGAAYNPGRAVGASFVHGIRVEDNFVATPDGRGPRRRRATLGRPGGRGAGRGSPGQWRVGVDGPPGQHHVRPRQASDSAHGGLLLGPLTRASDDGDCLELCGGRTGLGRGLVLGRSRPGLLGQDQLGGVLAEGILQGRLQRRLEVDEVVAVVVGPDGDGSPSRRLPGRVVGFGIPVVSLAVVREALNPGRRRRRHLVLLV
mmetsp:Transcript_6233/g.18887  ORF Transcript_6233/g.18887 Transcript_6233/m.18887 type:complete len:333 (-) Transcript_6233:294-1292(-)